MQNSCVSLQGMFGTCRTETPAALPLIILFRDMSIGYSQPQRKGREGRKVQETLVTGPLDQASCADPVVRDHGCQHYKHRPPSDRSRFAGPFPMYPRTLAVPSSIRGIPPWKA